MKNKLSIHLSMFFFSLLVTITLYSCDTENIDNSYKDFTDGAYLIYSQYDLVKIYNQDFKNISEIVTGELNNEKIDVNIEFGWVSFFIPDLKNGIYPIKFQNSIGKYMMSVNVISREPEKSPDTYLTDISSTFSESLEDFGKELDTITNPEIDKAAIQEDLDKLSAYMNEMKEHYKNLSSAEKREFAKFMDAYYKLKKDIDFELFNLYPNGPYSTKQYAPNFTYVYDFEFQLDQKFKMILFHGGLVYLHLPYVYDLLKFGKNINKRPAHIAVTLGAALACGVLTASLLIQSMNTLTSFLAFRSSTNSAFEFTLLRKSIEIFPEFSNSQIPSIEKSLSNELVFYSGENQPIDVEVKYRTITSSDAQANEYSGKYIHEFAHKYTNLLNKFNVISKDISDLFGVSLTFSPLSDNYRSTIRPLHSNYVAFSNISNPNVTITKVPASNGSTEIKVSTQEKTDQTFTFDLVYGNSNYAKNLKKQYRATVQADIDSTQIYEEACLGFWSVVGYEDSKPGGSYKMELLPGGKGLYHMPDNKTTYEIKWKITKKGGQYRMYEWGFWHPAYDFSPRERLKYPVKSFKTYSNFEPGVIIQEFIKR